MPFLAPLLPAIGAGATSAAAGAGVNALSQAAQGQSGAGNKAQGLGVTQSGGATTQLSPDQIAAASQQIDSNPSIPQSMKAQIKSQLATASGSQLVMPTTGAQAQQAASNVQSGLNQQQNLANQLAAQNGIQNQSSVYGQQQALANQLGQMAQGNGPSVANQQLANATGANVANQAALMAGQRGAGANVGLLARQAAQQGAATQQQAAGQGAALRQQEIFNSIGALQGQQGMLGNLATQQVGQQANAVGNLNQYAQGQQGQVLNALQGQNAILSGNQNTSNEINAKNALQNSAQAFDMTKGIASGLGSAAVAGTTPKKLAEGGIIDQIGKENYKGRSRIGKHLMMAKGGQLPMLDGGNVPGKPKVGGAKNSYANDTVDAKLSPGEIVLPRSVTMSKDPAMAAAKFVAALKAKQSKK